ETERERVAYHFGEIEGAAREALEAHLVGCAGCVRAFVEVKRAVETDAGDAGDVGNAGGGAGAPSVEARARLRRAVEAEVLPRAKASRWEKPIAFAVAASLVLAAGATTRALTVGPGSPPYAIA